MIVKEPVLPMPLAFMLFYPLMCRFPVYSLENVSAERLECLVLTAGDVLKSGTLLMDLL